MLAHTKFSAMLEKSFIQVSLKSRDLLQTFSIDYLNLLFPLVVISSRERFQKYFQVNEHMGRLDKGNTQLVWCPAPKIHTLPPPLYFSLAYGSNLELGLRIYIFK